MYRWIEAGGRTVVLLGGWGGGLLFGCVVSVALDTGCKRRTAANNYSRLLSIMFVKDLFQHRRWPCGLMVRRWFSVSKTTKDCAFESHRGRRFLLLLCRLCGRLIFVGSTKYSTTFQDNCIRSANHSLGLVELVFPLVVVSAA
jgi:hypothetical protein